MHTGLPAFRILRRDLRTLRLRLREATETLDAIRSGEVDAVVVRRGGGNEIYTLESAERPYRLFVEEMQQGAVTLGRDRTIRFCNRRFQDMLGLAGTAPLGRPFEELVAPGSRDDWRALLGRAGLGRADGEVWMQAAERSPVPTLIAISTLPPADGNGHCLVIADLTEQKQFERLRAAEAALSEREEMLETFVKHAPAAVAMFDRDMRYLACSDRWLEDYGIRPGEVTGFSHYDVFPEIGEAWKAVHRRCLAGASESCEEDSLVRPDGRTQWLRWQVHPWHAAGGEVGGIVIFTEDITGQRQAREALREANRRKDEFLATLAHELRNPLAPIRTAAHLLEMRGTQDPDIRELHDLIARQAGHMARIVDDLLDVARIEQGKLQLRKERVDLGTAAAQALEACRALLQGAGHRLETDFPPGRIEVEADPARVEQMICNLVNNACKYTPQGGTVRVQARREGAEAVLRVADTGIGMGPETLARIFDLFYQERQSLDRPSGGLGIGLTLVDRLVRLHGGQVQARSAGRGQGSEFTLRLPALEPARPGQDRPPGPDRDLRRANAERQRHVLVIDDNEGVLTTLRMLLEAFGFRVSTATSGEAGLASARAQRPDLVIVDLGLPGLDGFAVAAAIRRDLGDAIHLIAYSGYSRDKDVDAARAAGFDRHLVKSADPGGLIAAIGEGLDSLY